MADQPLWVYIPLLHRELMPPLPPEVLSFWPGLPLAAPSATLFLAACPHSPAEAAQCLRDWRSLDAEGLRASAQRPGPPETLSRAEQGALARFATGQGDGLPHMPDRALAQRRLLMAWLQEEHVLEIRALAERCRTGAERLAGRLGEDGGEAALPDPANAGALAEDAASLLPSWRFVLENMALFLPEGVVLCTADPRMAADLAEAGLCAAEQDGLSARCARPVRGERLPLWRALGRVRSDPSIPWLDKEALFLVFTPHAPLPNAPSPECGLTPARPAP